MGKQIRFYKNEEVEQAVLKKIDEIGLLRFDGNSGPFFAFKNPGENWFDSDCIQYSSRMGNDSFQGRLWTGSQNPDFEKIFQKLVRYIKVKAKYHQDSSSWVWKEYEVEFNVYYERKQKELEDLVIKNKAYAKNVLGANRKNNNS